MQVNAKARFLRIAPRKVRLVIDMVRGKKVGDALSILQFTQKRGAKVVSKLLNSAVANAENQGDIDIDTLYIKKIFVDQGPTLKRFKPRVPCVDDPQPQSDRMNLLSQFVLLKNQASSRMTDI
ncbi:50S ribosomal protein L22 [Thermodesulfobacteriota bacterium]